ncbi:MAG TPA: isochorismatase family protein [Candidatus Melainabacteria bacterium]|nr:isochorismatase family protein [Candidatus Melainabacteria bacterium]
MLLYEDLRWRLSHPEIASSAPSVVVPIKATLVVVDMQVFFPATRREATVDGAVELLRWALANNLAVVFLEHRGWGETLPRLMQVVEEAGAAGEALCSIKGKRTWDGSAEVEEVVRRRGFPEGQFFACGVNTHECVLDTVTGLSKRFPGSSINVVREACNCETHLPWSQFRQSKVLRHTSLETVLAN